MSDVLKTNRRWLSAWVFPLALLALPNCFLDSSGFGVDLEYQPGDNPTSAIMCDFPMPVGEGANECPDPDELDGGIDLAEAAVALVEGRNSTIALDYTTDQNACGGPKKIEFLAGQFPKGETVCINCGQMPSVFASPTKACIAKCKDLINAMGDGNVDAGEWCTAKAHISTNYESCDQYDGACTGGGNPIMGFDDPRKHPEKVEWTDLSGTDTLPNLNDLKRTADTTGNMDSDFNAGGASVQLIANGDAWVEFHAGQNDVSHVIGLRESCEKIIDCPDQDHTLGGIGFTISLNNDNGVYVLEKGTPLGVQGPFGLPYTPGERFRVRATDKHNGTAEISYYRVAPGCVDGTPCATELLYTSSTLATYPLRVDAIFREKDATLENVTIVRIKPQQ